MLARSLLVLFAIVVVACGSGDAAAQSGRCDFCGMRIDPSSGWRSGGRAADGHELAFDTPKCLFRYRFTRGEVRDPWVTEYYGQARRDASALRYALGSDVLGPMGRDLVPLEGDDAVERFRRDHSAQRILRYDEVTAAMAAELFQPSPR